MICGWCKAAPGAAVTWLIIITYSIDKHNKTSCGKYACSFVILCYTFMDFSIRICIKLCILNICPLLVFLVAVTESIPAALLTPV